MSQHTADAVAKFHRYCLLLVDLVVKNRSVPEMVTRWGDGNVRDDPAGGEPFPDDAMLRCRPCPGCARQVVAGIPRALAASKWDRCPTCVSDKDMIAHVEAQLGRDNRPMPPVEVRALIAGLAAHLGAKPAVRPRLQRETRDRSHRTAALKAAIARCSDPIEVAALQRILDDG